jgi:hypothetical protein
VTWRDLRKVVLSPRELVIEPKVAVDPLHEDGARVEPLAAVCRFRGEFYRCLGARADAQFELADALLCAEGPVRTLVDLSLARSIAADTGRYMTGSTRARSRSPGSARVWPG